MRKFLLTLLIAVPAFVVAQDATVPTKFEWTKDKGLTDYIVVPLEGKTAAKMYTEVFGWMVDRSDLKIIKKVDDEFVVVEGRTTELFCSNVMGSANCEPVIYTFEMSFKDGKYKFDVTSMKWDEKSSNMLIPIEIAPPFTSNYYNKKGEIRNAYKWISDSLPNFMDKLSADFKERFSTRTGPKNDW